MCLLIFRKWENILGLALTKMAAQSHDKISSFVFVEEKSFIDHNFRVFFRAVRFTECDVRVSAN